MTLKEAIDIVEKENKGAKVLYGTEYESCFAFAMGDSNGNIFMDSHTRVVDKKTKRYKKVFLFSDEYQKLSSEKILNEFDL